MFLPNASFQNSYPYNMPIGIPGRIADCGFKNTLSPRALEAIPAARGVMKPLNLDYCITLPRVNLGTIAISVALITGNTFNATINGVALTPTIYATSSAATMEAIATKIREIPTVQSATVAVDGLSITIVSVPGFTTTVTGSAVTGGASQPTVTQSAAATGTFFGVTQHIYNKMNAWIPDFGPNLTVSSGFESPYYTGQVIPTLTQGRIYVVPENVVTSNSPVYLRVAPNGANTSLGTFSGIADGGNSVLIPATQAIWREGNGIVGGIAVLELNIP
jgi:hypothetical protein